MSPKVTITRGERVIGEVDVQDDEVFRVAAKTLRLEAARKYEAGETLGTLYESPEEILKILELEKLAEVLDKARKRPPKS